MEQDLPPESVQSQGTSGTSDAIPEGTVSRIWDGVLCFPGLFWNMLCWQLNPLIRLYYVIVTSLDGSRGKQRKLICWLEAMSGREVRDLQAVWEDGSIVCDVINAILVGNCEPKDHHGNCLRHAQELASHHFKLLPAFSNTELQKSFSSSLEKRLWRYLLALRNALKLRVANNIAEQEDKDPEYLIAEEYVARGMGLILASQGERAIFFIYSRDDSSLADIHINIKGPNGDCGEATAGEPIDAEGHSIEIDYRLTPDYLKVCYIPKSLGHHELSLTRYGFNIPGSPFVIKVGEHTGPPSEKFSYLEWLTDEQEEEKRLELEKKKNLKVVSRVIDFITEKMYVTDDGIMIKVDESSLRAPSPISYNIKRGGRSLSPRPRGKLSSQKRSKSLTNQKLRQAAEFLRCSTSKEEKKLVQDAASQVSDDFSMIQPGGVDQFQEKCQRIVKVCDFLLSHGPKQKSLEILTTAEKILDIPYNSSLTHHRSLFELYKPGNGSDFNSILVKDDNILESSRSTESEEDEEKETVIKSCTPEINVTRVDYSDRLYSMRRMDDIGDTVTDVKNDGSKSKIISTSNLNKEEERSKSVSPHKNASIARKSFKTVGYTKANRSTLSSLSMNDVSDEMDNSGSQKDDISSISCEDEKEKEVNNENDGIPSIVEVNAQQIENGKDEFGGSHENKENHNTSSEKDKNIKNIPHTQQSESSKRNTPELIENEHSFNRPSRSTTPKNTRNSKQAKKVSNLVEKFENKLISKSSSNVEHEVPEAVEIVDSQQVLCQNFKLLGTDNIGKKEGKEPCNEKEVIFNRTVEKSIACEKDVLEDQALEYFDADSNMSEKVRSSVSGNQIEIMKDNMGASETKINVCQKSYEQTEFGLEDTETHESPNILNETPTITNSIKSRISAFEDYSRKFDTDSEFVKKFRKVNVIDEPRKSLHPSQNNTTLDGIREEFSLTIVEFSNNSPISNESIISSNNQNSNELNHIEIGRIMGTEKEKGSSLMLSSPRGYQSECGNIDLKQESDARTVEENEQSTSQLSRGSCKSIDDSNECVLLSVKYQSFDHYSKNIDTTTKDLEGVESYPSNTAEKIYCAVDEEQIKNGRTEPPSDGVYLQVDENITPSEDLFDALGYLTQQASIDESLTGEYEVTTLEDEYFCCEDSKEISQMSVTGYEGDDSNSCSKGDITVQNDKSSNLISELYSEILLPQSVIEVDSSFKCNGGSKNSENLISPSTDSKLEEANFQEKNLLQESSKEVSAIEGGGLLINTCQKVDVTGSPLAEEVTEGNNHQIQYSLLNLSPNPMEQMRIDTEDNKEENLEIKEEKYVESSIHESHIEDEDNKGIDKDSCLEGTNDNFTLTSEPFIEVDVASQECILSENGEEQEMESPHAHGKIGSLTKFDPTSDLGAEKNADSTIKLETEERAEHDTILESGAERNVEFSPPENEEEQKQDSSQTLGEIEIHAEIDSDLELGVEKSAELDSTMELGPGESATLESGADKIVEFDLTLESGPERNVELDSSLELMGEKSAQLHSTLETAEQLSPEIEVITSPDNKESHHQDGTESSESNIEEKEEKEISEDAQENLGEEGNYGLNKTLSVKSGTTDEHMNEESFVKDEISASSSVHENTVPIESDSMLNFNMKVNESREKRPETDINLVTQTSVEGKVEEINDNSINSREITIANESEHISLDGKNQIDNNEKVEGGEVTNVNFGIILDSALPKSVEDSSTCGGMEEEEGEMKEKNQEQVPVSENSKILINDGKKDEIEETIIKVQSLKVSESIDDCIIGVNNGNNVGKELLQGDSSLVIKSKIEEEIIAEENRGEVEEEIKEILAIEDEREVGERTNAEDKIKIEENIKWIEEEEELKGEQVGKIEGEEPATRSKEEKTVSEGKQNMEEKLVIRDKEEFGKSKTAMEDKEEKEEKHTTEDKDKVEVEKTIAEGKDEVEMEETTSKDVDEIEGGELVTVGREEVEEGIPATGDEGEEDGRTGMEGKVGVEETVKESLDEMEVEKPTIEDKVEMKEDKHESEGEITALKDEGEIEFEETATEVKDGVDEGKIVREAEKEIEEEPTKENRGGVEEDKKIIDGKEDFEEIPEKEDKEEKYAETAMETRMTIVIDEQEINDKIEAKKVKYEVEEEKPEKEDKEEVAGERAEIETEYEEGRETLAVGNEDIVEEEKPFIEVVEELKEVEDVKSVIGVNNRIEEGEAIEDKEEVEEENATVGDKEVLEEGKQTIEDRKEVEDEKRAIKDEKVLEEEKEVIEDKEVLEEEKQTIEDKEQVEEEKPVMEDKKVLEGEKQTIGDKEEVEEERATIEDNEELKEVEQTIEVKEVGGEKAAIEHEDKMKYNPPIKYEIELKTPIEVIGKIEEESPATGDKHKVEVETSIENKDEIKLEEQENEEGLEKEKVSIEDKEEDEIENSAIGDEGQIEYSELETKDDVEEEEPAVEDEEEIRKTEILAKYEVKEGTLVIENRDEVEAEESALNDEKLEVGEVETENEVKEEIEVTGNKEEPEEVKTAIIDGEDSEGGKQKMEDKGKVGEEKPKLEDTCEEKEENPIILDGDKGEEMRTAIEVNDKIEEENPAIVDEDGVKEVETTMGVEDEIGVEEPVIENIEEIEEEKVEIGRKEEEENLEMEDKVAIVAIECNETAIESKYEVEEEESAVKNKEEEVEESRTGVIAEYQTVGKTLATENRYEVKADKPTIEDKEESEGEGIVKEEKEDLEGREPSIEYEKRNMKGEEAKLPIEDEVRKVKTAMDVKDGLEEDKEGKRAIEHEKQLEEETTGIDNKEDVEEGKRGLENEGKRAIEDKEKVGKEKGDQDDVEEKKLAMEVEDGVGIEQTPIKVEDEDEMKKEREAIENLNETGGCDVLGESEEGRSSIIEDNEEVEVEIAVEHKGESGREKIQIESEEKVEEEKEEQTMKDKQELGEEKSLTEDKDKVDEEEQSMKDKQELGEEKSLTVAKDKVKKEEEQAIEHEGKLEEENTAIEERAIEGGEKHGAEDTSEQDKEGDLAKEDIERREEDIEKREEDIEGKKGSIVDHGVKEEKPVIEDTVGDEEENPSLEDEKSIGKEKIIVIDGKEELEVKNGSDTEISSEVKVLGNDDGILLDSNLIQSAKVEAEEEQRKGAELEQREQSKLEQRAGEEPREEKNVQPREKTEEELREKVGEKQEREDDNRSLFRSDHNITLNPYYNDNNKNDICQREIQIKEDEFKHEKIASELSTVEKIKVGDIIDTLIEFSNGHLGLEINYLDDSVTQDYNELLESKTSVLNDEQNETTDLKPDDLVIETVIEESNMNQGDELLKLTTDSERYEYDKSEDEHDINGIEEDSEVFHGNELEKEDKILIKETGELVHSNIPEILSKSEVSGVNNVNMLGCKSKGEGFLGIGEDIMKDEVLCCSNHDEFDIKIKENDEVIQSDATDNENLLINIDNSIERKNDFNQQISTSVLDDFQDYTADQRQLEEIFVPTEDPMQVAVSQTESILVLNDSNEQNIAIEEAKTDLGKVESSSILTSSELFIESRNEENIQLNDFQQVENIVKESDCIHKNYENNIEGEIEDGDDLKQILPINENISEDEKAVSETIVQVISSESEPEKSLLIANEHKVDNSLINLSSDVDDNIVKEEGEISEADGINKCNEKAEKISMSEETATNVDEQNISDSNSEVQEINRKNIVNEMTCNMSEESIKVNIESSENMSNNSEIPVEMSVSLDINQLETGTENVEISIVDIGSNNMHEADSLLELGGEKHISEDLLKEEMEIEKEGDNFCVDNRENTFIGSKISIEEDLDKNPNKEFIDDENFNDQKLVEVATEDLVMNRDNIDCGNELSSVNTGAMIDIITEEIQCDFKGEIPIEVSKHGRESPSMQEKGEFENISTPSYETDNSAEMELLKFDDNVNVTDDHNCCDQNKSLIETLKVEELVENRISSFDGGDSNKIVFDAESTETAAIKVSNGNSLKNNLIIESDMTVETSLIEERKIIALDGLLQIDEGESTTDERIIPSEDETHDKSLEPEIPSSKSMENIELLTKSQDVGIPLVDVDIPSNNHQGEVNSILIMDMDDSKTNHAFAEDLLKKQEGLEGESSQDRKLITDSTVVAAQKTVTKENSSINDAKENEYYEKEHSLNLKSDSKAHVGEALVFENTEEDSNENTIESRKILNSSLNIKDILEESSSPFELSALSLGRQETFLLVNLSKDNQTDEEKVSVTPDKSEEICVKNLIERFSNESVSNSNREESSKEVENIKFGSLNEGDINMEVDKPGQGNELSKLIKQFESGIIDTEQHKISLGLEGRQKYSDKDVEHNVNDEVIIDDGLTELSVAHPSPDDSSIKPNFVEDVENSTFPVQHEFDLCSLGSKDNEVISKSYTDISDGVDDSLTTNENFGSSEHLLLCVGGVGDLENVEMTLPTSEAVGHDEIDKSTEENMEKVDLSIRSSSSSIEIKKELETEQDIKHMVEATSSIEESTTCSKVLITDDAGVDMLSSNIGTVEKASVDISLHEKKLDSENSNGVKIIEGIAAGAKVLLEENPDKKPLVVEECEITNDYSSRSIDTTNIEEAVNTRTDGKQDNLSLAMEAPDCSDQSEMKPENIREAPIGFSLITPELTEDLFCAVNSSSNSVMSVSSNNQDLDPQSRDVCYEILNEISNEKSKVEEDSLLRSLISDKQGTDSSGSELNRSISLIVNSSLESDYNFCGSLQDDFGGKNQTISECVFDMLMSNNERLESVEEPERDSLEDIAAPEAGETCTDNEEQVNNELVLFEKHTIDQGENESASDSHLWQSNTDLEPSGRMSLMSDLTEDIDFDSIISAPSLDEALKKFEKRLWDKMSKDSSFGFQSSEERICGGEEIAEMETIHDVHEEVMSENTDFQKETSDNNVIETALLCDEDGIPQDMENSIIDEKLTSPILHQKLSTTHACGESGKEYQEIDIINQCQILIDSKDPGEGEPSSDSKPPLTSASKYQISRPSSRMEMIREEIEEENVNKIEHLKEGNLTPLIDSDEVSVSDISECLEKFDTLLQEAELNDLDLLSHNYDSSSAKVCENILVQISVTDCDAKEVVHENLLIESEIPECDRIIDDFPINIDSQSQNELDKLEFDSSARNSTLNNDNFINTGSIDGVSLLNDSICNEDMKKEDLTLDHHIDNVRSDSIKASLDQNAEQSDPTTEANEGETRISLVMSKKLFWDQKFKTLQTEEENRSKMLTKKKNITVTKDLTNENINIEPIEKIDKMMDRPSEPEKVANDSIEQIHPSKQTESNISSNNESKGNETIEIVVECSDEHSIENVDDQKSVVKWNNYWNNIVNEQDEQLQEIKRQPSIRIKGIVATSKRMFEKSSSNLERSTSCEVLSIKTNLNNRTHMPTRSVGENLNKIGLETSSFNYMEFGENSLGLNSSSNTFHRSESVSNISERIKFFERTNVNNKNEGKAQINKIDTSMTLRFKKNYFEESISTPCSPTTIKIDYFDDNPNTPLPQLKNNESIDSSDGDLYNPLTMTLCGRIRSFSTGKIEEAPDGSLSNIEEDRSINEEHQDDDGLFAGVKKGSEYDAPMLSRAKSEGNLTINEQVTSRARFQQAKMFFKCLEEESVNPRKKVTDDRSGMELKKSTRLRQISMDSDSCGEVCKPKKKESKYRRRGRRRKKDSTMKVRSAPTSDSEYKVYDSEYGGSERHRSKRVAERFHVKNLFRDISGDSDGIFKGIPNRRAVLASLEDLRADSCPDGQQTFESDEPGRSQSMSSIPSGYQDEYPYLPTTPPSQFRPRSQFEERLISRCRLVTYEMDI